MTDPVLSIDAAKLHLRVDGDAEDSLILDAIAAAQAWIEDYTILVLTRRQIVESADGLGRAIELRAWPVISIDSITYYDHSGTQQQLAEGSWWTNLDRRPVRLAPAIGSRWPRSAAAPGSVSITITVGYDDPSEIPATAMQALKLLVGHFYTNRMPAAVGQSIAVVEVPLTVSDMLRKWRRRLI